MRCTGFFVAVRMVARCVCRCEGGGGGCPVCLFRLFFRDVSSHFVYDVGRDGSVAGFLWYAFLGSLLIGVGYAG